MAGEGWNHLNICGGWEKSLPKCVLGFNSGGAGHWMF